MLNSLSHYRFRQHLLNKASEYGCRVELVNEAFTSMTCTFCGRLGTSYEYKKNGERVKVCDCKNGVDRDINGARNIYMKTLLGRKA